MKIDLSDVKVGDEVFHSVFGYLPCHKNYGKNITVKVPSGWVCIFSHDGKADQKEKYASLFHSARECAEYFKGVSDGV